MSDAKPIRLIEVGDAEARFLVYETDTGPRLDIRYTGDQLWMTQAQIAELFGRDVSVISRHIAAVVEDGELDESNLQKMQIATSTKPVAFYSIDMVISVGYRVSSKQATIFRRWATEALVAFATKGFVVDKVRLKNPDNRDRVAELRDIIRDIRSDEANLYRELRQICALCQDYAGDSEAWRRFYRNTQAKFVYAVCSQTPAEVIANRADAAKDNMGLHTWPHDNIRKADVIVSKNYLAEREIRELNRLTVILLDIFEDQLDIGRLTTMAQAEALLDKQLADLGRQVLRSGGSRTMIEAQQIAEAQYQRFREAERAKRHAEADAVIAEIKATQKALPKTRTRKPG